MNAYVVWDLALDGDDNGDSVAAAGTEDFAAFLAGLFTSRSLVAAKIINIDVAELVL